MRRTWLALAAIFGALGVMAGAFGAHGLQKLTDDPAILNSFDTAARYQLIHAVALLAVAILAAQDNFPAVKWSAIFFIAGIILFSGSLYLISYLKIRGAGVGILGPITPLGGLLLILGWIMLLVASFVRQGGVKVK
jgi:uncharacterized membrane protein YgdD (TMEM256/DUF423 family)